MVQLYAIKGIHPLLSLIFSINKIILFHLSILQYIYMKEKCKIYLSL